MSEPAGAVTLLLPDALVTDIAERAAVIVLARLTPSEALASPYLSVREAAAYIRSKPQRIYDLRSSGRLTRFTDGRRALVSRVELDAYLEAGSRPVAPALPHIAPARMERAIAA